MKTLPFSISRRTWALGVLAMVMVLLTACGGDEKPWPGVSESPDGDTIYFSYEKLVTSINADKSRNWNYEYDGAKFFAPSLITEDTVYVGDFKGRFHAIDRESGKGKWVYEFERASFLGLLNFGTNDRVIASAEQGQDRIFFGTERGIFAVTADGDEAEIDWEFTETEHSIWAKPIYIEDEENGIEPTLIVASLDKHIYGLNPEDGKPRWTLGLEGAVASEPTIDLQNGVMYAGTLNSLLYAISLDGEVLHIYEADGWIWGNPTIYDDVLYFGDLKGRLYALTYTNADGFEEVWTKDLDETALRPSPVIVDDILIISAEDSKVYGLNIADHSIKWTNDGLDAKVLSDLTVTTIDGKSAVIVGTTERDRILIALNVEDGKQIWNYKYED